MDRINANVKSLIARRAIVDVSQADRIAAVSDSRLQAVCSLNSLRKITRENMTAAGNAIRDADFAVEVSHLTRARILASSSISGLRPVDAKAREEVSDSSATRGASGCGPPPSSLSFDIGSFVRS